MMHPAILSCLRYYYSYLLDMYLTFYDDKVKLVLNILNIEIGNLRHKMRGRHPDSIMNLKERHKFGLFLASVKERVEQGCKTYD